MGQRIDDEIREQELKEKAKRLGLFEKILMPEGIAELRVDAMEVAKRFVALEEKVENERELAEKVAELNAARWEKFENEIKEKISLWLADVNEPIHKQIDNLQERITELEALVKGHPHNIPSPQTLLDKQTGAVIKIGKAVPIKKED